MQEFWDTVSVHKSSIRFTINKKKFSLDVEIFKEILQICLKIPGQESEDLLIEHDILSFIRDLRHSGDITYFTDVNVDYLHQPWRAFATVINKCLSGKETGMDKIHFLFQIEYKDAKKTNKMSYPRFTKIIIDYFMSKDQSISRRNKMFWHTTRDDTVFTSMRCIYRHEDTQVYGTILPKELTNQAMLESKTYQTYYAFASGEKTLKVKYVRKKADFVTSPKQKIVQATKDEETSTILGVPDVPIYESESEKESWGDSEDKDEDDENDYDDISDEGDDDNDGNNGNDGDDDNANDDDKQEGDDTNDDDEETDSDRTEPDRIKIPKLDQSTTEYYEEEEKIDDEETMFNDEDNEVTKELYEDVNVNLGNEDTEMTNADQKASGQQNADELVQSSSVSSDFTSKLLNLENPSPADNEIASLMETSARHATAVPEITSGFTTTIHPPPPFFNPLLQHATPAPTPTTSEATTSFTSLPNFTSVFKFNERVTNLEKDLSEIKQVDQYAQALSSIPAIADRYMDNKLGEAINKAIQAHNFDCREEAQAEKREYIELVDSTKNVTESLEVSVLTRSSSQPQSSYETAATLSEFKLTKILIDKMERNKSYDIADHKRELYDALVKSYQIDKDLFDSYGEVFSLKRSQEDRDKDRDPFAGSDRVTKRRKSSKDAVSSRDSRSKEKKSSSTSKDASQSNISLPASLPMQMSQVILFKTQACNKIKSSSRETKMNSPLTRRLPKPTGSRNPSDLQLLILIRLNDTSFDFSAFVMNRLKIPNLTQEILVGPTFNLLKGTCKSITELEYHLEECSKATTERLD
ncbi:hypothetical protein Tco_0443460 [Tanacetum coccineum]